MFLKENENGNNFFLIDRISTFSRICAIFSDQSAEEIAQTLLEVAIAVRGRLFPKCLDEKAHIQNVILQNVWEVNALLKIDIAKV